jgi:hypothetical protein
LLQLLLGEPLGIALEIGTGFGAAGLQAGIDDLPGIGDVELGEERAQRIGRERRDRARLGAEAESMQGERRPSWIKGHDVRSWTDEP